MTPRYHARLAHHAHHLADDLPRLETLLRRRRALEWIAATAGLSLAGACVADPAETAGPYPADGTNTSSGSTSDVLTASGVVRGDIRASFMGRRRSRRACR